MRHPQRPWIIDLEASGFGANSYPIEVGVAMDENQRFCSLIKPVNGWDYWDRQAESYHCISRELLASHGCGVHEVAEELNKLLAGRTVYSDGWVVDKPWLIKLFHAASRPMKFSISPLELILSEQQMTDWHATKDALLHESGMVRHRASNDALLIQQTYCQTLPARACGAL